jgi:hypothetical protein
MSHREAKNKAQEKSSEVIRSSCAASSGPSATTTKSIKHQKKKRSAPKNEMKLRSQRMIACFSRRLVCPFCSASSIAISSLGCREFMSSPFRCLQNNKARGASHVHEDWNLKCTSLEMEAKFGFRKRNVKGKVSCKHWPELNLHVVVLLLDPVDLCTQALKHIPLSNHSACALWCCKTNGEKRLPCDSHPTVSSRSWSGTSPRSWTVCSQTKGCVSFFFSCSKEKETKH